MDQHGLVVESRVQQVGATVAEYEAQMAAFFERLRAEEDPTRIATMAERMPEPPDLAGVAAAIVEPVTQAAEAAEAELVADEPTLEGDGSEMTEAEASAETGDSRDRAEQSTPDFAAAEAEAATFTGDGEDEAASEPAADHDRSRSPPPPRWQRPPTTARRRASAPRPASIVTGLVSVASIATFKRSLGRVPGVSTIGVASGPDGEFVFTVSHDSGIGLGEAIAALPGLRGSGHGGDRRRPRGHRARPRRRLLTPTARIPRSHHVARPAIVVALPLSESTTVSAELLAAGFEVIEIEQPRELEKALDVRRDIALAILDGEIEPPRPTTTTPSCAAPDGRSRP